MKCLQPRRLSLLGIIPALIVVNFLPWSFFTSQVQAANTITGTVFQDYNANGIKDSGAYTYASVVASAIDQGIGGITVTATDSNGVTVSTTTAANGTYSLTNNGSGTLRVEFSGFPNAYQPGPNGGAVTPDGSPSNLVLAGTLVQFVAPNGKANLGLIRPEEYCQNNPQLAYACYKGGDPLGGGASGTADVLFTIPYSANGTTPTPTTLAKGMQVGTVWGETWQRDTKQLFTSAFVKRHTGLGPLGTGGIYVTGLSTGSPVVSPYLDVKTVGIDTGAFATARGLPANPTTPSTDIEAFAQVGKLGIGGISLSDDGSTLWLVNLHDRTLYSIAIGNPAKSSAVLRASDVTSYAATAPWLTTSPCVNGIARPFGVKYYRDKVYVGVVCTAENGGTINDLQGTVYALDPGTAVFSTILTMPLNFKRGLATSRVSGSNYWFPWTDTYSDAAFRPGTISDCCSGLQVSRPMPLLSDIEFDAGGAMILGFVDRASHQFGNAQPRPVAGDTIKLYGASGGDILRACPNAAGTYVLESNGSCGGVNGAVGNGQGPGNGEFYSGDNYSTPSHQETSVGGLAYLPGSYLSEMSAMDPLSYNSGGIYWMNNSNGGSSRRYQAYISTDTTTFGKAAGLGDITLLCDSAPIEIGNHVWRDTNGNGVQDPLETGIGGATVHLYAPDGTTVLATAATDASGSYYFSSATGMDTSSAKYGITGLTANTNGYSVRLDNLTNYATGGPLAGLLLSPVDAGGNSQDQRDSDATLVGGFPLVPFNTGGHGANNHSYDIGFSPYSLGNRIWLDTNNNGLLDPGESGTANVSVSLFADANADGVHDSATPLTTTSTDSGGYYRFDTLLAGTYVVRVDPINFQPGGALVGLFSSTTTIATPNDDIDSDDNGSDDTNQSTNGIFSGSVTLGPGANEPTGETDLSASGQSAADTQANMTVDFGFYQKLNLGNFVWYDTNNNGQYDSGEQPIPGVTVRLYADTNGNNTLDSSDATVGSNQVTDPNGQYLFTNLDPGAYFVQVLQTNFSSGGALSGYSNSSGAFPGDANDNKDHGTPVTGQGVVSEQVTLTYGGEPTSDGDSDTNTNLTIDFGFYRLTVGNQIWRDDNNNGQINAGEPNLSGVRVELYDSTNTLVAVTTTDSNGQYLFDQQTDNVGVATGVGLATGDYYVAIPASQFGKGGTLAGYYSSIGNDANDTTDSNDNGVDAAVPATTGIRSATFTLTPGGEPNVTQSNGTTNNPTIDFGFYTMSLGNLVWLDSNDNGLYDTGEPRLPFVAMNLYYDANNNGTIDGGETTPIATTTTDNNGEYLFTGLAAGDYMVEVAGSNFASGALYNGYYSSIGSSTIVIGPYEPAPAPDTIVVDNDDNGTVNGSLLAVNSIQSAMVTLVAGTEPDSTVETGGNSVSNPAPDTNTNLTVDFGLLAAVGIGNRVWIDTNNNGLRDASESYVPDGVILNLYYDANGNDTIDGTETTPLLSTTTSGGEYAFGPLVPGNYIVELAAANFQQGGLLASYTSSTGTNGSLTGPSEPAPDPDAVEIDDDDNGTIVGTLGNGGSIRSPLTTLTFRGEPTGEGSNIPVGPDYSSSINATVDFGVFTPASLGNFVWYDKNHNGTQDPGENGVQNVSVTLHRSADSSVVATTTTDANGAYQFTNLVPDSYYITVSNLPNGFVFTQQDVGGDDSTDSDVNPISGTSGSATIAAGTSTQTLDVGIYDDVRASLGDFVWYDLNENGVQDAGEVGVSSVTVQLYDATNTLLATTTTNASGSYAFSNLLEGDYYVVFTPPANYAFSPQDNAGGNDTIDSDANPTNGRTITTHLDPGETDPNWDAGIYYTKVVLGNRVWNDTNDDGRDNGIGGGIPNVTLNLYRDSNDDGVPDGASIATTTTDANGYYLFTLLDPDTYIVEAIPPAGYRNSSGVSGSATGPYEPAPDPDNNIDQDDNGTTSGNAVRSGPITLTRSGEPTGESATQSNTDTITPDVNSNLTVDFGLYQPLSLGNLVWSDANNNGLFDTGEHGVANVPVRLYDATNTLIASIITNQNGNYLFTNLGRGDYTVEITLPNGYVSSSDIASSPQPNNGIDDDDNGVVLSNNTARSATVSLLNNTEPVDDPGQPAGNANRNPTLDFGIYQPLSLGNVVWNDANNNGTFDASENGIDGVTVNLYRDANSNNQIDAGEFVTSQTTSGGGLYLFTNLSPGEYLVELPASNFTAGQPLEHFASSTGGNSEPAPDPDNNTNNDDNGTAQPDTSTLSLPITLTSGGEPTNDGDSDANTNLSVDFGVYPLASLGDFAWLDANKNGVQDGGENGVPGVTVQLYQPGPDGLVGTSDDVPVATTTTGANGIYQFGNLVPATYFVDFTPPVGYAFTTQNSASATASTNSDADVTTGQTVITTLAPGQNDTSWDAGLYYTASLGDRAWLDQNGNGIQDAGEPGLAGATITLFTSAGTQVGGAATTDANGNYGFSNLPPGDYYLTVTPPSGFSITRLNQGSDDTADSDADPSNGRTTTISIAPGQADPSWDIGLYHPVSLGDQVWLDQNDNGLLDPGEPGLSGVTVRLFASDGVSELPVGPDGVLGTGDDAPGGVQTSPSGTYLFANLAPGDYVVAVTSPNGASSSTDIATSATPNTDVDNDDNGVIVSNGTVRSGTITLTTGGEPNDDPGQAQGNADRNVTVDFGFYQPLSLGNVVWNDANNNGVLDGSETGSDGVAVNLYRDANNNGLVDAGEFVTSQLTSGGGRYLFTGLRPGEYLVELPSANFASGAVLANFASSTGGGSEPAVDPDTDSDNDDNGTAQPNGSVLSLPITLASGNEPTNDGDSDANTNLSVDFGVYPLASLGDFVWLDANKNGVQDAGENGIPGVTVQLYQPGPDGTAGTSDDVLVATTSTGMKGEYQFTDLVPGSYFVQFGMPAGYARSPQNSASATASTNSDADVTTGQAVITTLAPGQNDTSWDAGLYYTANLGDRVWLDQNGDGIQDAGEPGLAGATVTLYTGTGVQVGVSVTTDSSGSYAFSNVPPGDYYVAVTPPSGYLITQLNQGNDDTVDSDADPATGQTTTITLALGQADPNWDIGIYHPLSLGNLIWNDTNNNGIVDGVESGIDGVVVNLYRDANGDGKPDPSELNGTQTSSNGGQYRFLNLMPGSYIAQLDPSNFGGSGKLVGYTSSTGSIGTNLAGTGVYEPASSPDNDIDNDDNGSLVNNQGIVSLPIILASDSEPVDDDDIDPNTNLTLDFGVFQAASLGSIVWNDANKNGIRDPGEPGVSNVTVTLYDSNSNPLATTTTDANGNYLFTNVPPGSYSVGFSDLPADTTFTQPNQGPSNVNDSDVEPNTGRTGPIIIVPGENNTTINSGLIPVTPTAITLTSFTAAYKGDHVIVRWVTAAEIQTWGFRLYRSTDGQRTHAVEVTPNLIPGKGRGQGGASYSWTDTDIADGVTYSYWLVEVELSGETHEYGPVQARLQPASSSYQVFLPVVQR